MIAQYTPFSLVPLQTAIDDCESMFARLDFTLAQARGALAVVCDTDFDSCATGDMHAIEREADAIVDRMTVQMLDSCLGAPHSYAEAALVATYLDDGSEPIECSSCGRWHVGVAG